MKRFGIIIAISILASIAILSCGKRYKTPTEVPPAGNLGDTLYLMLNPPWDAAHGYNFSGITSIYFGRDTYFYVADTGNNRVIQMDVAGTVHEQYNIPHPISISQDELMRLLIVTGEKKIYRVDLGPTGDRLPKVVYELGNSVYGNLTMHKDSTMLDTTDQFMSITDLPANDKSYYVAVSSPTKNDGRILWFWGSSQNSEYCDSIFDSRFGVANGDTFVNPVVTTGNGITTTIRPTSIYAYETGGALHVVVCQDSGSYPVHDMLYMQQYWDLTWVYTYSRLPSECPMLQSGCFDKPKAMTLDPHGNIYIVDAGPGRECGAYKYSKTGELLNTFCEPDSIDVFNSPGGISYDIYGDRRTVYIADTGNNRIMRYKLSTDLEP